MYREIILSICIPTFNRGFHVLELVNDILATKLKDIEIIVLDNASTDTTRKLLEQVSDGRLRYIRNENNIGGKLNAVKVLFEPRGTYSMLCLDRDSINVSQLFNLCSFLKQHDIALGYCVLQTTNDDDFTVFKGGFESLLKMAYLSKHPTGNIYRTSLLKALIDYNDVKSEFFDFDFIHEFINSRLSSSGMSAIVNLPIIETGYFNSKKDFALSGSHSFREGNLYFKPSKRVDHLLLYLDDIAQMNLTVLQEYRLKRRVLLQAMVYSTLSYRKFMRDEFVCSHYNIKIVHISYIQFLPILYSLIKSYINSQKRSPYWLTCLIIVISLLRYVIHVIYNIAKNVY